MYKTGQSLRVASSKQQLKHWLENLKVLTENVASIAKINK